MLVLSTKTTNKIYTVVNILSNINQNLYKSSFLMPLYLFICTLSEKRQNEDLSRDIDKVRILQGSHLRKICTLKVEKKCLSIFLIKFQDII